MAVPHKVWKGVLMKPLFSIIVVCLNPGNKLSETLASIRDQDFQDYEVVVKDGLSKDGSLERIGEGFPEGKMRLFCQKDRGIYDAMNQAVGKANGAYVYFLNCGDRFYSGQVLSRMAEFIRQRHVDVGALKNPVGEGNPPGIYYGNIFERITGQKVVSNPHMDAFGCYRNVPCHQACFYSRELLLAHPFDIRYKVRADYEQFLWCFFVAGAKRKVVFAYQDLLVADYEGGGFSEIRENRRISAKEHKEITEKYLSKGQLLKFRMAMALSLAPIRTQIASNERTAGIYNRLKGAVYKRKR